MAIPPSPVLHGAARALPAADTRRTAREQIGLAVLAVERAGRGVLARMRRSRLLRWRYRSPAADELVLAPPDLRGGDATFADDIGLRQDLAIRVSLASNSLVDEIRLSPIERFDIGCVGDKAVAALQLAAA